MEATFITIHDLSPEAHILYCSDSIVDVLGYSPEEVAHRQPWYFFHPDEVHAARARHGKVIQQDKAAVLAYGRLMGKDGRWIGCEMVFTVSFDCLIGCTSIYRNGVRSLTRAVDAPPIRRLFSNSPRDPRYHMLTHLSSKFTGPFKPETHEPRAALFLNRYTRTLTIMYATEGLADVLGISGEQLRGRSFYYCIQEGCLKDSVKCLENAKANDSIAYLRFWFRDPRQDDRYERLRDRRAAQEDEMMQDIRSSDDDTETGGIRLDEEMRDSSYSDRIRSESSTDSQAVSSSTSAEPIRGAHSDQHAQSAESRTSSHESNVQDSHEGVFGEPPPRESSFSSPADSSTESRAQFRSRTPAEQIELEAVVSCASDGLVVTLRRARPIAPQPAYPAAKPLKTTGLFAVPWSPDPILPPIQQRMQYSQDTNYAPDFTFSEAPQGLVEPQPKFPQNDFMNTIRDIAVFAWAVVGINGSLAEYGRGKPSGGAQPPSGLPIWRPDAREQERSAYPGNPGGLISGIQPSTSTGNGKGDPETRLEAPLPGASGNIAGSTWSPNVFGDPGLSTEPRNPTGAPPPNYGQPTSEQDAARSSHGN